MSDHLAPAREVNTQQEHPHPDGRAVTEATGFGLEGWPASGGAGSHSPNAIKGERATNNELESPIHK